MAFIIIISVVIILVSYIAMKSIAYTPGIHGDHALAKLETVTLGGVGQSILIRSADTRNPILLYLHSGPGSTEMVAFRAAHPNLEKHFTVVTWEQRGTGKSFGSSLRQEDMTMEQMVSDTGELMKYLLERFHQEKLFVVGHSWGTALGLMAAEKYPQYIYAYAGSGQEVKPAEAEKLSYAYTLASAQAAGNAAAVKELKQLNEDYPYLTMPENPNWYADLKTERKWLVQFGGEAYQRDNCSFMITPALGLSEYTLNDFIRFAKGSEFSLKALWPEVMKLDFKQTLQKINVPVFFLQGRHDQNTPSALLLDYYAILDAPEKELIWFENSGHHPMYEEPEKYDEILITKLLPYATR